MKNNSLVFSTCLILIAGFTLVSGAFLFSKNLSRVLSYWGDQFQMTVYLAEDAEKASVLGLIESLKSYPDIKKVEWITHQEALQLFQQQMASFAPDLAKEPDLLDFIPQSLIINLQEKALEDKNKTFLQLQQDLKQHPLIREVFYGEEWLKKYAFFVNSLKTLIWIVCILFCVSSLFVISNAIRSLVSERQEEIAILELIGATYWSIRKDFILTGINMGVLAASLSLVISFAFYYIGKSYLTESYGLVFLASKLSFHSTYFIIGYLLLGALAGATGFFLAAKNINTGWAAAQTQQRNRFAK